MFPFNDNGMLSGLLCGILFGYVLENAGFGSPVKLSAQFKLTDWAVFKVMFTAIVVAAVGLWLLKIGGLLRPDSIAVPQAALVAAALGGALVGAGFATGGYCPGTSVAGLFSGRLDALVFIVGVLLISALLVTPAVIARMVTDSFARMLVIAPLVGAACGAVGMVISYHADISSGASIILLAAFVFIVVYTVTGARGRGNAGGMIH